MELIDDDLKANILGAINYGYVTAAAAKVVIRPESLVECELTVRVVLDPESRHLAAILEEAPEHI